MSTVRYKAPLRLAVVIISWNNMTETSKCLEGLASWKTMRPGIIVVDNGSADGGARELEERFPGVTVLRSKANLGYTGGNNLAIRKALEQSVRYILLLNADASLAETDAARLLGIMDARPDLGIIGPLLREGSMVYAGGADIGRHLNTRIRWSPAMGFEGIKMVDYVPGAALIVRRESIEKAGLLDEEYFFSGEVADLCRRLRDAGMACGIDLCSRATHMVEICAPNRDTLYIYYNLRNRFLYVKKHHAGRRWRLHCLWAGYCIRESLFSLAKGKTGRARAALLALLDGMTGRFGDRNGHFIA